MSGNEILLDVEIFPDYGRIEVSDVQRRDSPDSEGRTTGIASTDHTVAVFTMSADQAVDNDQNVRVRVYRGTDTDLGAMVFDQNIEFTDPPRLGVFALLDDEGPEVPVEHTGPVRLQIFINPPQEAEEVNVLIRYDL